MNWQYTVKHSDVNIHFYNIILSSCQTDKNGTIDVIHCCYLESHLSDQQDDNTSIYDL